jgi:glycerophosphoryl diester phosphodiesterase
VPEIHGHRGARALRPENTLPGLAHALAIGVDALEFDVTLTGDGGLILAHDLTVDASVIRETGPATAGDPVFPYVGRRWLDLTGDQVATLDAGGRWPADPFRSTFRAIPSTGVPTLDQVCRLVTEAGADRVVLSVELKTDPSWQEADVRRLTGSALRMLAAHELSGRARILGFDWRVLRAAQATDESVPRVALVEPTTWTPGSAWLAGLDPADYPDGGSALGSADAARHVGATWLSPWEPMVTADLMAAARDAGLGVIAWTANSEDRMAELAGLGVDGIVTDNPGVLRHVLAGRGDRLPASCELPWPDGVPGWAPRTRVASR